MLVQVLNSLKLLVNMTLSRGFNGENCEQKSFSQKSSS